MLGLDERLEDQRSRSWLGFTIKLGQPDGQYLKTFLIGKMTRDKSSAVSLMMPE
jgi:hypothetical protein